MRTLRRILCADDESDMRMLIKMALENVGGFSVTACASGRELLDKAPDSNADLIILDAVMPSMSGLETLKLLREIESCSNTPVLFMTGKAREAEAEFMAAGAIGVVTKPFDPIYLAQDVKTLWERHHGG